MESGVGVGGAVGGDQQLRTGEIGRGDGCQPDLHRPLGQAAGLLGRGSGRAVRGSDVHGAGAGTSAAAGRGGADQLLCFVGQNGGLVIGSGLPLHEGDGTGGTGGQAVAQPVAVVVAHELSLAVDHGDSALVTGVGAGAAAVAFFLIYFDDASFHVKILLAVLVVVYHTLSINLPAESE